MNNIDYKRWIVNFTKSIAYMTKDVIAENMTNTTDIVSSIGSATENAIDAASNAVEKIQANLTPDKIQNSRQYKDVMAVVKGAARDIKTGDFAHLVTDEDDFGSDYGVDMNFDFDESVDDDSDENSNPATASVTNDAKLTATATINASNRQIMALSQMTSSLGKNQSQNAKVLAKSLFSSASIAANLIHGDITATNQRLDIINTNIENLVKFNQTQSKANEAALQHYARMEEAIGMAMGMYYNANGDFNKAKGITKNYDDPNELKKDLLRYGFNANTYGNMVKGNIKATGIDSATELVKNMFGILGDTMSLGSITDMVNLQTPIKKIISKFMPKRTMRSLRGLDKRIPNTINLGLNMLGDHADDSSPLGMIASILGIKTDTKKYAELGSYNKGAIAWNGTSKKALEEVIPGYLARIEKAVLDIQNPNVKHDERYYDYGKGVYRASTQIVQDYKNKLQQRRRDIYRDANDTFDRSMTDSVGNYLISDRAMKSLKSEISKIINYAAENGDKVKTKDVSNNIEAALKKYAPQLTKIERYDIISSYVNALRLEQIKNSEDSDKLVHSVDSSSMRQLWSAHQEKGYLKDDIFGRVAPTLSSDSIYKETGAEKERRLKKEAADKKAKAQKEATVATITNRMKNSDNKGIQKLREAIKYLKSDDMDGILSAKTDNTIASYIDAFTGMMYDAASGNMQNPFPTIIDDFSDKKLKAIPSLAIKARNELESASTDATTYNTSFEGKSGTHAVVYMRDFRKAIKKWNNTLSENDYDISKSNDPDDPRFFSAELKKSNYVIGAPIKIYASDIQIPECTIRSNIAVVKEDLSDNKTVGHGTFKHHRATVVGRAIDQSQPYSENNNSFKDASSDTRRSVSRGQPEKKHRKVSAAVGGLHKNIKEKEAEKKAFSDAEAVKSALKNLGNVWQVTAKKYQTKEEFRATVKGAAKGALAGSIAGVFLPGGPIGGALLGAAVGIIRSKVDFKKVLFGDKIVDDQGNVVGIKQTGLIEQWGNTVQTAFIDNMRTEMDVTKDYLKSYFDDKVSPQIDDFFKARTDRFKDIFDGVSDKVVTVVNSILHPIQALNNLSVKLVNKALVMGTKMLGAAVRTGGKVVAQVVATPFKIGNKIKDLIDYGTGTIVKNDIRNRARGVKTGAEYLAGRITGKIDKFTDYSDYRKKVGAGGVKYDKDGNVDYSDIDKERDDAYAAIDQDPDMQLLKKKDPKKYDLLRKEKINNIDAQYRKKRQNIEYRDRSWQKRTATVSRWRDDRKWNKKVAKDRRAYDKIINKYNKKDAGRFVELTDEEAQERYNAIKATITNQPKDIREAFNMIDPKNAADIENFINNRQNFVKMKKNQIESSKADEENKRYRARVIAGTDTTNELLCKLVSVGSSGAYTPQYDEKSGKLKNLDKVTAGDLATAQVAVAKEMNKITDQDKKDPEGYKASVTDSNDADKPLVDENGKLIDKNKDDGEKKEKKSLFATIKDFITGINNFDFKGTLTGILNGIKSMGSNILGIATKIGGIAATAGVGTATVAGAAGLAGNGMAALNSIGIGSNQDTIVNEALGNKDKNGNRTAYVDKDGNLAKAGSKGATKQVIRNDVMAENAFKSTARLVTGTSNTAKVVVKGAKYVAEKVSQSDQWITLVCVIGDAIDKLKNNKTFQKVCGKAGNSVIGKITKWLAGLKNLPIVEGAKAKISQWGAKYAAVVGTKAFKYAAAAVTAAWDVVSGMCDAANLFQVNSDDVDGLMKGISVVMKLIADFCPFADAFVFFAEIADELTGSNVLCTMASMMYNTIWDFANKNSGKENTLAQHQQELEDEVDAYNAENGTNISVKAYNDQKNRTLGGKILDFVTGNNRNKSLEKNTVDTKAYVNKNTASNSGVRLATSSGAMASAVGKGTKTVGHGSMVSQFDSDISNLSMGDGYNVSNGGCGVATMANMLGMSGKSAYNASAGHRTQGGMTSKDMMDTVRSVTGSSTELSNMDSMNSALDSGKNVAVLGNVGRGGKNAHWINVTGKNADGTYNWQDPETGEVSGYLDPNQIDSAVVGRASIDRLDTRVQKNSIKYKASISKKKGSTDRLDTRIQKNSISPKNAQNRSTNTSSNGADTSGATTKLKDNGTTIQNGSYYFAQNNQSWSKQSLSGFNSSVNNSGCVMTSAAMGVSDLLGKPIDPGTFNSTYGNGNTHSTDFSALGIDVQRLPPNATSASTTNPSTVANQLTAALKAGKPVMLYGTNAPGKVFHDGYSKSGSHCVLATGIDDQGNIIVNNPYSGGQEKYKDTHWPLSSLNGLHWIQIMSKDGKGASGRGIVPSAGATIASTATGTTNASSYASASGNSSATTGLATSSGAMATAVPSGVAGLADNGSTIQHGTYYFSQNGQRWSNDKISGMNANIGSAGCVLTSAAMGASGLAGQSIDPGTFNKTYGNGNVSGTKFSSLGIDVTRYPSGGSMSKIADPSPYLDTIKNALANRMPVMLYGDKTASNIYMDGKAGSPHCVIATGLDENGNVIINNPWSTAQKRYAQKTYPLNASTLQPFHWAQVMSKDGKGIDGTSGFTAPDSAAATTDGTTGTASTGIGDNIKKGLSNLGSMFGNLGMSMLNNLFKSGGNAQSMLDMTANDASWKQSENSSADAGVSDSGHMRMPTLQQSAHRKNFVSEKTIGHGSSGSMEGIPSQLDTITSLLTTIAKNTSTSGHGSYHNGDFGGGHVGHGSNNSLVMTKKTQSQKEKEAQAAANLLKSKTGSNSTNNSTSNRLRANHEKIASGYRSTVS